MVSKRGLLIFGIMILIYLIFVFIGAVILDSMESDMSYRDALDLLVLNSTSIGGATKQPTTTGAIWFNMVYSTLLVSMFLFSLLITFEIFVGDKL